MSATVAVARQSVRLMRREVGQLATLVVMPLILIMIFLPVARGALRDSGFRTANGAEQAVPGMTVGFGLFLLGFMGMAFMSERIWGTWDRLRASRASAGQIVLGKLIPSFGLAVAYQLTMFALGAVLFGLRARGQVLALALIFPAFGACIVAIGIFVASVARTPQQINVVGNVAGMGLSALGGAYVPATLLPGWAQAIAPVTPTYWAVRGFRVGLLPGYSMTTAFASAAILTALALIFGTTAAARLRAEARSRK